MNNREIIGRVRNTLKEHSIDSVLSNKHIYNVLRTATTFLVKRDADSKNTIYNQSGLWSTICIDMIPVSAIDCISCFDLPVDCEIYRSKTKLPGYIETAYGVLYKSLTSVDRSEDITITTPYSYKLKKNLKYNKNKYAFIENDYLYTPNVEFPSLRFTGYLEKVPKDKEHCTIMSQTFACPQYLIDAVVKLAVQELLQYKQLPYDNIENKDERNLLV